MDFSVICFECVCIYQSSAVPRTERRVAYQKVISFQKAGAGKKGSCRRVMVLSFETNSIFLGGHTLAGNGG
jgi:hypothetical protein